MSQSSDEARWWPRRDDSPFMSQLPRLPPLEATGTSRDTPAPCGLADRGPRWWKDDFQLGRVCTLFLGLSWASADVLECAAADGPSRDEVLCVSRLGSPRSPWLSLLVSSEPQPTVHGEPLCSDMGGPSGVGPVKSWLCLRMRTVIRCWTREVPAGERRQALL